MLTKRSGAASYRVQSFTRTLYDRPYRFVVVHSSHVDQRKQRKGERELGEEKEALHQAVRDLECQSFVCLPDAELALKRFAAKWEGTPYTWESKIQERVTFKRRPDRPRKGGNRPRKSRIRFPFRWENSVLERRRSGGAREWLRAGDEHP